MACFPGARTYGLAMKRGHLAILAAFIATQLGSPVGVRGAEDGVEPQAHDPEKCAAADKVCFKEWYDEYKVGLIDEFKHYRSIENDVARGIRKSDDMLAAQLVGDLIAGQYYKHNHWKFAKSFVDGTGPSLKQYETIIWDCRVAISTMIFLLVDIQDYHAQINEDRNFYVKSAQTCERVFKLGSLDSTLRQLK
jgi:hypothetical protein